MTTHSDPVVLIPWQDTDCQHRLKAMFETMRHWDEDHGLVYRVCRLKRGEPWCKAAALASGWADTPDVVIVADADCLVSPQAVGDCVRIVADGRAWAIPHWDVRRLTRASTERRLGGGVPWVTEAETLERPQYLGVGAGGVLVIRTDVALDVPMDSTYKEWGGEDYSWGLALDTLADAPYRPSEHTDLIHLYHPRHERSKTGTNLSSDEARRQRYFTAWAERDTVTMRELVEGGRVWPSPQSTSS